MTVARRPSVRDLREFMLRCALRLQCEDQCFHTAVMILERIKDGSMLEKFCAYTTALTILNIACKMEEDIDRNLRDLANVGISSEPPKCDKVFMDIRKGLATLEYIVLRELDFNIVQKRPLNHLYIYLHQLRCWEPESFNKHSIAERSMAILKDIYVEPQFIHDYEPEEIALASIAIALDGYGISISGCGKKGKKDWYEVLYSEMTDKKMQKLQKKILSDVYSIHVEE